jgi:biotin-[acetyl-CoA-carboxylase] ligase BirA-like protein
MHHTLAPTLDGERVDLGRATITRWEHCTTVPSTMDIAHALADDGAPSGTVVVADEQRSGRGRNGARWVSMPTFGLWCTLIERVPTSLVTDATSLRLGLLIAEVLEPFHDGAVGVKWPNDVLLARTPAAAGTDGAAAPITARWSKGAGVLVEARWRGERVDWVAVGIGINCAVPARSVEHAAFAPGAPHRTPSRAALLEALIPRLRRALQQGGPLTRAEQQAWYERDVARGARCVAPAHGMVDGISATGALLVRVLAHTVVAGSASPPISPPDLIQEIRTGSLRLSDETVAP